MVSHAKKDYGELAENIIKITEENIFDPKIIQSKKWKKFRKKIRNAALKTVDDLEFQIGFFALIRNFNIGYVKNKEYKGIDTSKTL